jgi:hypothetical protein
MQTKPKIAVLLDTYFNNKIVSKQAIMELLHISKDTFYKRMSGESPFLLHEAQALAKALQFNLDSLDNTNTKGDSIQKTFTIKNFPTLTTPQATVAAYIDTLHKDLTTVGSLDLLQLYYAAKDLPLFCFFSSPTLASFKLYFWYITIFDSQSILNKYDTQWVPDDVLQKANDVYMLYCKCDSTEIWNFETIYSTLHQIHYCKEAGLISKKDITVLLNALRDFVQQLKHNCETGSKNGLGKLTIYLNEILLLDNSVIFETKAVKIFYLPFQTLNFLSNTDADFTDNCLKWFHKQIAKSTIISSASQRDRNRLISHYIDEIEKYS